jgi:SAM-dependent methyltransferase
VDISDEQLKQDQKVAKEFGLDIKTIDSSADDLSMLEDGYFDIIVNPLSNCFFEKLEPVWRECARVLRPGGKLMYAFNNPIAYLFDFKKANRGEYTLKYSQPYSDTLSLDDKEKEMSLSKDSPLEFGHELSTQMGAMLRCGFVINDLFEDYWSEDRNESHDLHFAQFINVLATKLPLNL